MYRAALYCRLSKEDFCEIQNNHESKSIQNQKMLLKEFALKNGFLIYDIYVDEDYSGLDSTRPAFHKMIKDAEERKFDVILCKTQSRFTRDMEMVEKYIHGLFSVWGIRFIGVVDCVDTNKKENKKIRQINGLINEWYCEDLSENIKSVYKSKMQQGQYLGAFAPYGYKKDEKDRHKLVIDEEAAEVVKKIFQYCIEGYGTQNICYKLQEEHILPPSEYKKRKGLSFKTPNSEKYGAKYLLWGGTTVKKILKNEVYIGTLIQGKEKKVSYKSKKVVAAPKEEWIIIENNHEPIISKKEFYQVQNILKLRRKFSKVSDTQKKVYPLAGKVKCKDCGSAMTRSGKKGTGDNYLRCGLAGKSASKKCSNHTIKYSVLEEKILEALQNYAEGILEYDFKKISEDEGKKEKNLILKWKKDLKYLYLKKQKWEKDFQNHFESTYCKNLKKKIENVSSAIEIKEKKLKILEFYTDFKNSEKKLTNKLVFDFIDFIEIGEKKGNEGQDIMIHWKF